MQVELAPEDIRSFSFADAFRIGRSNDCEVRLEHAFVSRVHAEVSCSEGQWSIRDLGSSNGMFLEGRRVESVLIDGRLTVRLGVRGPLLLLEVQHPLPEPVAAEPEQTNEQIAEAAARYFGRMSASDMASDRTLVIRQAFQQHQKKQRRKQFWLVGTLAAALFGLAGFAWYQQREWNKREAIAQDLFYSMKALEVQIGSVQVLLAQSSNQQQRDQVQRYRSERVEMEKGYDRFLDSLHVYSKTLSEQDRLILRVTRVFGECELNMPPDYVAEVKNYIKKWQATDKLAKAMATAERSGYSSKISQEFLAKDLPPEFFYLALQESGFNPAAVGPPTRSGLAKGMWQFIPKTGVKYGLRIGPLEDVSRPDPGDDRNNWEKETTAAASYIKDLYTTDAQASGLLVMASYNWGEDRVLPLIRSMPSNPRDRNFWKLLAKYRTQLPDETYDYVFYIVSAAVIGENPHLFGFNFDNPLESAQKK